MGHQPCLPLLWHLRPLESSNLQASPAEPAGSVLWLCYAPGWKNRLLFFDVWHILSKTLKWKPSKQQLKHIFIILYTFILKWLRLNRSQLPMISPSNLSYICRHWSLWWKDRQCCSTKGFFGAEPSDGSWSSLTKFGMRAMRTARNDREYDQPITHRIHVWYIYIYANMTGVYWW